MEVPLIAWLGLLAVVLVVIVLDTFVFGRNPHEVTFKEAGVWSAIYISIGLAFTGVVAWAWGGEAASQYLAGFLVEKSLSLDNIFIFAIIFGAFNVPLIYRQRALLWGVTGALVMRLIFILLGSALLSAFHWTIYLFGGILLVTAWRLLRSGEDHVDPERNPVLRVMRRFLPMSQEWDGQKLVTRIDTKRALTPMAAVLVVIMATDLVFAVDSIPAIFAITEEPFIVMAANVFALLGLRALYFMLDGMVHRFVYLKPALAIVLAFVGVKMLLIDVFKFPIAVSLGVIVGVIGGSIILSLYRTKTPTSSS